MSYASQEDWDRLNAALVALGIKPPESGAPLDIWVSYLAAELERLRTRVVMRP